MTLAAILLISVVCASPALPSRGQTTPSTQNAPNSSQPSSPATPAQKSPGQVPIKPAPKHHHKRRALPPNCTPAAAGTQAASPTDPPAAAAPLPCPPPKVVVQQGGASDPNIHLAGGTPGSQTSHERDTAKQMLGSTEANLKKIAGSQLTPNQQDMVNQIHQFMDQSKAAVEAGDLDRARTLAWKAQLLSEELVKPGK